MSAAGMHKRFSQYNKDGLLTDEEQRNITNAKIIESEIKLFKKRATITRDEPEEEMDILKVSKIV